MRRGASWVVPLGLLLAACGGKTDDASPGTGGGSSGGSGGVVGTGGSAPSGGGGVGGAVSGCVVESSGELPPLIAPTGSFTGPGIVATDTGFVIGYRDQDGGSLRALLLSLSDAGVLGAPSVFDLGGCANVVPTDGVSLAYKNGLGMLAASLPNCGKGAGAVFIPFDDKGKDEQASVPKNATFELLDTSVHAVAPGKLPGEWEFVYALTSNLQTSVVERILLQGPVFKTNVPIAHPFDEQPRPWASVVTGSEVVGLLSPNPAGKTLELLMGPLGEGALNVGPAPALPAADAGDLVAWDARVAAGVRTASGLHLSVFELATGGIDTVATGELPSAGAVISALAVDADQLFAAHGSPGSIQLDRVGGAQGTPSLAAVSSVKLGADFDGSHLAVAAARGRVALVWLGKSKLSSSESAGGWRILRCD